MNFRLKEVSFLVGGRIFNKLSFSLLQFVLILHWNSFLYGEFSAKLGTWRILYPILSIGITKCALKILPRFKQIKKTLLKSIIWLCLIVLLLSTALILLITIAIPLIIGHSIDYLDLLVGILSLMSSYMITIQGIGRALNKDHYDYSISIIAGTFNLIICLMMFIKSFSPIAITLCMISIYLIINFIGTYQIWKISWSMSKRFSRNSKNIFLRMTKESVVMGINGFIGTASFSIINVGFRFLNMFEVSAYFNFASSIFSIGMSFFQYLTRVYIPVFSKVIQRNCLNYYQKYQKKLIYFIFSTLLFSIIIFSFAFFIESFFTFSNSKYLYPIIIWVLLSPVFMITEIVILYFELHSGKTQLWTILANLSGFFVTTLLAILLIPYGNTLLVLLSIIGGEVSIVLVLTIQLISLNQNRLTLKISDFVKKK